MSKIKLTDYLSKGKETAKTAKELQSLLGLKTVRAVTLEINRLRNNGDVILSSNTGEYMGFYLPDTKDEISHFVRSSPGAFFNEYPFHLRKPRLLTDAGVLEAS